MKVKILKAICNSHKIYINEYSDTDFHTQSFQDLTDWEDVSYDCYTQLEHKIRWYNMNNKHGDRVLLLVDGYRNVNEFMEECDKLQEQERIRRQKEQEEFDKKNKKKIVSKKERELKQLQRLQKKYSGIIANI